MGVSKFEYFGNTLFDLTSDTVTPETLAEGFTAHNAAGDLITGIMQTTAAEGNVEIDTSVNLHDASTDVPNVYISNGSEVAYNGWSATDYIPLTLGKYYAMKASALDGKYCAFYNTSKTYVRNFGGSCGNITASNSESYVIFKAVGNYVRISDTTSKLANIAIYPCINVGQEKLLTLPEGFAMEMGLYTPTSDTSSAVTIDLKNTFRWADTGKESACYISMFAVDLKKGTQAAGAGLHVKFGIGERNHQMVTTTSGCSTSSTIFMNPISTTTFNQITMTGTAAYPLKAGITYLWLVIGELAV